MAFFVRWNWRKVVFLCIFLTIIINSTWISESYRSESSWANKSESHGFWSIKVSLSQPSDSSHGGGSICLKIRFCLATSGSLYLFIFDTCRTFVKDVNPNTFVRIRWRDMNQVFVLIFSTQQKPWFVHIFYDVTSAGKMGKAPFLLPCRPGSLNDLQLCFRGWKPSTWAFWDSDPQEYTTESPR